MVTRIYMPGSAAWSNAEIRIDGRMYNASLRDGFLALPLPPGEHVFNSLRTLADLVSHNQIDQHDPIRPVRGSSGGYRAPIYVPSYGPSTVIHYKILPIDRTFKVETGKVVNLGLYVFLTDTNDKNKFYTLNFDNSTDVAHYLQANYPTLMASLRDRAVKLATGNYDNAEKLQAVRRITALREVAAGRLLSTDSDTVFGYGDAGTIAWIKGLAKDKDAAINVLDTGTLAKIVDVQQDGDNALFLTADAKLITVDKNKRLTSSDIPYTMHTARLRVLAKSGDFIVVDNRMRIASSSDKGATWKLFDSAAQKIPTNSYNFVFTDKGYYIYATDGVSSSIVQHRYGQPDYQIVKAPDSSTGYNGGTLLETSSGLYLIRATQRIFFFLAKNRQDWQVRYKPGTCKTITPGTNGRQLTAKCEDGTYESTDSGNTWKKPAT